MVHTRFSEMTIEDDPVIEMHESQLDKLRARANLVIPSGILGLLAIALLLVGALRVESNARKLESSAESRIGAMAAEVETLKKQLADRTDPARIADVAREANAGSLGNASADARRALSIAQRTEASVAPVTEQVAAFDGRLTNVQSGLDALSQAGTTQRTELAKMSQSLDALRTGQEQRLQAMDRQIQSQDAQLSSQDKDLASNKKWTRIVGVGTAVTLGIVTAHTLGHGSR